MLVEIKLYGGLTCQNKELKSFGSKKISVTIPEGTSLKEVHRLLNLTPSKNLVSIVNGKAQLPDFVLEGEARISIFPPMADRSYNLFDKI